MVLGALGSQDGQAGYVSAGDYDGDGDVDGVDVFIWRGTFEAP